jgi:hypothetical protein
MNTTPNKASLWKSCVEQGIFDSVPPDAMYQVQGLFERVIQQFQQGDVDLAKANQLVLKEFRFQLGKLTGQTVQQKSFEELNEEYRDQYQPKPPTQIEFSREKDSPLQDIEAILQQKSEQRQNEIQEFFKEESKTMDMSQPVQKMGPPVTQPRVQTLQSVGSIGSPLGSLEPIQSVQAKENELVLHRRILESILTSQLKIIELLQRK